MSLFLTESAGRSVVSDSLQPHGLTIQSMEFSRPAYWSGEPFPSSEDLPNPGTKPRSPAWQVDSLPTEPQGRPKNTGVGSLSLLQRIFPTQELNQDLLTCRRILYQLSYLNKIHPNNQSLYKYDSWFLLCTFWYCFMILMMQSLTSTPNPVLPQRKLLLLPEKHVNSRQK